MEIYVPIHYDDPEPLILESSQHYSTPQNRPNLTPPTEPIQAQSNPPYSTHHPPHTTHPPHPSHLPPRRYYAPLPSPPDHHHHHPTHSAYPTYHPEGTMHLCLRPPNTTTTTTKPTTPTPPTTQKVLCTFAFAPRPPPPPPPHHPTTHHHTTQPPTHSPIRYECVFYHRRICSIVKIIFLPRVFAYRLRLLALTVCLSPKC